MDDLLRALDEGLLSELKCPVCSECMVPPIQLCTNGHNICSRCKGTVQCCPTCNNEFSEARNVALENIVRSQKYPCAKRQSGYIEWFSIEHMVKHQIGCLYGEIKCPFHINTRCRSKCRKSDMKDYLEENHTGSLQETSTFRSDLSQGLRVRVLFCFGELFVHCQRKRNGKFYSAVQLIGTSSEASKYKCEFTLRAAKAGEQISYTFFVRSYEEDWETSFNSGKCFCLDEALVRYFVVETGHSLTLTLSTVE